ncbi:ABC-F family ATP-binding cassette domain-containing protein [Entomobacter blattae]|uniref:ABC transporter ATP-binding protein uup n=1 Tax=Entomobacter blattae TaxID=2762277 RepID=A0A7H1NS25_9PROT|nr:ABC-F family ATP-binding cassette domain-containing protein [Entomobacter blattae]QNT78585.1 ABC transporter ATP-binding protein uup [Entomobacter blattae]
MAPPLLSLQNISYTLGGKPLLEGAEISVGYHEKLALVGRNGSGKSTLLRIASGQILPDSGEIFIQPSITRRYLSQEPNLRAYKTTLDYVNTGLVDPHYEHESLSLLQELGLTGQENPHHLSGGEARRCAIAQALVGHPDLLMLDEPTNHLDMPTIEWLEKKLLSLSAALILISHDRRLLETVSQAVIWLDRGTCRKLNQGFQHFESWRDAVLAEEELTAHKLDRQIAREEDWMRYGVTARRKRNVRRVQELAQLRQQKREAIKQPNQLALQASQAILSGKLVIAAEGVSKSYGERPIVKALSLRLQRGEKLAIVGANGSGKTTLLNLLTKTLPPDEGEITLGSNLAMVTLDQQRNALNPATTLADTLTGGGGDMVQVGSEHRHVIGYMKDFLFKPEQARTPVGVLSGGERGRLLLAKALAQPSNLLVLDEPTNDLDLETLDLLEEMLSQYEGSVLLVSHDRNFIDRIATSVLTLAETAQWVEYAGGYSDMLAQKQAVPPAPPSGKKETLKNGNPSASKNKSAFSEEKGPKTKLSFKEKFALENLPKTIAGLEEEIQKLRTILSDPALYHKDQAKFTQTSTLLAQKETALREAEERWLELEILRQDIEKK